MVDSPYYLRYVAFEGLSLFSKLVKFFTRSKYSHIAVQLSDQLLIEAWKKGGVICWDYSTFSRHTPGTPYVVYALPVTETVYNKAVDFYTYLADRRMPYNYLGVLGFVLPIFTSNGGYFCSEGCWEGLVFADRCMFGGVPGWKVSPDMFVNLITVRGATIIESGYTP